MSDSVRNLINAISAGSAIDTEESFNAAMAEKISIKLDAMRQDVATNMFATEELKEEVELNEVSKSEVDHHYDKWTNSEHAPNNSDAGDDNKVHKSALKYLRNTNEPKENHEKIAMHIANKFHGSGVD